MRRQGIGRWPCATPKCRPGSGGVRCRNLLPMRSERTGRKVKYTPSARVRRMNMAARWRGAGHGARIKYILWHYISFPDRGSGISKRKCAESGRIPRRSRLLMVKMGQGTAVDAVRACELPPYPSTHKITTNRTSANASDAWWTGGGRRMT